MAPSFSIVNYFVLTYISVKKINYLKTEVIKCIETQLREGWEQRSGHSQLVQLTLYSTSGSSLYVGTYYHNINFQLASN